MSTTSTVARGAPAARASWRLPSPLRLVREIGTTHGWIVLLLAFAISLDIPLAVVDINWLDDVNILWPVALLAIAIGIVLALVRPRDVRSFLVAVLAGVLGIFIAIGQVLPAPARLAHDATELFGWITSAGASEPAGQNPVFRMIGNGAQAAATFGGQLVQWWQLGGFGEADIDNRIFLFFISVVTWVVLLYFAWALYSGTAPMVALLPPGVVLVSFVVLGGQGAPYVYLFLLTALLMILRMHVLALERDWNRRNLDYPTTVGPEVLVTGVLFTLLVGAVALLLPRAPQNTLAVHFWRVFDGPWSHLEANVGEAFTGVRHRVGGNGGNDLYLGGPLAFGDVQVVFYAQTDEPPPPSETDRELEAEGYVEPEHYFAGASYAEYNGSAWTTGKVEGVSRTGVPIGANGQPDYLGIGDGTSTAQTRQPNQPITTTPIQGQRVVQQIERVSGGPALVYAYNTPVQIDQSYTVRESGGLPDRVELTGSEKKYTVISVIPEPSANELRASGTQYPAWLAPYLDKPNVPARVGQLAEQWAGPANNPYDKAMAIEGELRKIPYTTDIVAPPRGRDPIDYFLFDLKRGYCEYYASAMVVMLRDVGVPARIVTGYATTTYDQKQNAYEATQDDAHTWVQVYFNGVGWLDFEPTPVNPELVRPEVDQPASDVAIAAPAPRAPARPHVAFPIDLRIIGVALAAVIIGLVTYIIRRQWEAELSPRDYVRLQYARMVRRSGRYGLKKRSEETALEFGHRLARQFELSAEPVAVAARQIATLYVLAQYAQVQLGETERNRAAEAWRTLRYRLWRLTRHKER